jgi:hypothetical protein
MHSGYTGWLGGLYDWQSLVAGGLALLAGIVTVWGTLRAAKRQVRAANETADREIKAANEAADRQIAAAQEQTAAAQHQTAVTEELERRRIAREGYAFHAMLEAAIGAVIADVEAARKLPTSPLPDRYTYEAYSIRQRVSRAGFPELRPALMRFGGTQTAQFLQKATASMPSWKCPARRQVSHRLRIRTADHPSNISYIRWSRWLLPR